MCKPLGPFRPRSYAYNGDGNVIDMKAYSGVSANQETTYGYGVNPSNGSSITSNDLLYAVQYPDLSTGAASMYQQESYAYDAAGETTFSMDRNASTHVYSYDVLGRLTQDLANYGGTNAYHVDMTVDRLVYAYDSAGRLASVKSKNGSSVVNETDRTYNGFGQVVEEDQPNGSVEYSYSTPDPEGSGLNASRLTGMSYGHESLTYSYDSGVDARISRLSGIDGARLSNGDPVRLEGYTYLGLSTVVARTDAEIGTLSAAGLTLIGSTTSALTGDPYVGLDTFGRIADQRWTDGSGSAMDEFQYAYDADSNPVARVNALSTPNSEAYAYDALDRLTSFSRQTVTVTGSTTAPTVTASGTASATQTWNYDSLGNWATMSFNGSTHSSTFNSQNQLVTNGPTSSTLAYDANGNTTTDENGNALHYDLWNRMTSWTDHLGSTTNTYSYDGLGRRYGVAFTGAAVADPAPDTAWLLSLAGQVLTEAFARSGTETVEYDEVWSPVYVNAMVCRDEWDQESIILSGHGGTEVDGPSTRIYPRTDANYDVTSIVASTDGSTWTTPERYVYTPYGVRTVKSSNWTGSATGSTVGFTQGFQGGFYDAGSGLVLFNKCSPNETGGGRYLSPASGTFCQQDRARVGNNVYEFANLTPLVQTDPTGLKSAIALSDFQDDQRDGYLGAMTRKSTLQETLENHLGQSQKDCPQCQQEAKDIANAILADIAKGGTTFGGDFGNFLYYFGIGTDCGGWQQRMLAAITPVFQKYGNGSCFAANTIDIWDASKPKNSYYQDTHNYIEIHCGDGTTLMLDPWPSGGGNPFDSTEQYAYPKPKYTDSHSLVPGSPTKPNSNPCGCDHEDDGNDKAQP